MSIKPISEWSTDEIKQWIYAIGERSDRVISRAMDNDDWSEYESDEKLYKELEQEMWHRGLYANGKPIPTISAEMEPELARLVAKGKILEAQRLIISEFNKSTASDNPPSEG